MGVKKFYRPILGYDGKVIDGGVPSWDDITGKPAPGAAVADAADETEVVAQFNALLASLRTSGAIET